MRKILFSIIMALTLTACNNEETQDNTNEESTPVQTEEKTKSVLNDLPDFQIPLQTFVDSYNNNGMKGFTPIEKDPYEMEFVDETLGYSKTLISETIDTTDYSIVAMFDQDKKFKRITFTQTIEDTPNEKSTITLLSLFAALGIDSNYVIEFLDAGTDQTDYTTKEYKISFKKMDTVGLFNVAIDSL